MASSFCTRVFLVVGGLLLSPCADAAAADDEIITYELRLDGLVSANVVSSYNDDSTIPYDMIQDLSTAFAADICETYSKLMMVRPRSSMDLMAEDETTRMLDLVDQRCYEIKSGGRCVMDYHEQENNMSLHVETYFYLLSHARRGVAVRLDASLTSAGGEGDSHYKGRETLVLVVPKIEAQLELENRSAWSIHRRLSFDQMTETWDTLSSASSAQLDREYRASSVESMILENSRLKNRKRLEAGKSDTSPFVEVWQFEDPDRVDPVRALFINGQLQTISSFAGAAHAEAFVHPVLIAHPDPTRVAIVSLEPSALVKEVLKYKSIQKVTLLGADMLAVEMSKRLLPSLQDCSFLEESSVSCMEQDGVELVIESYVSWLRDIVESENQHGKYFDVILVDVPNGGDKLLSPDMYASLDWLADDWSIMVAISSGSAPSLFDANAEYTDTPRDHLLRTAALYEKNGGLGMDALLFYDEPLAKPLASSYFVFFADASLGSYERFVRRNAVLVDEDIVERFHSGIKSSTGRPTEVFDGPQSEMYHDISRVWEDWFCKTEPGRSSEICKSTLSNLYDKSFHFYDTEVRRDKVKGRSLFARTDIPAGHFVLPNDAGLALHVPKEQWDALNKFIDDFPDLPMYPKVRDFIVAYGFEDYVLGHGGWSVSFPSNNTFTNHGCTENEVNVEFLRSAFAGEGSNDTAFSPPLTRRSHLFGILVHTTRDVKAGEEIMCDYMTFRSDDRDPDMRKFLDTICNEGIGLIPAEGVSKDDEL
jgi:spermidine synthase